jgi:hypothetical protein
MSKRDRRREDGTSFRSDTNNQGMTLADVSASIYGFENLQHSDELTVVDAATFQFRNFQLSRVGFEMPTGALVTADDFADLGDLLFALDGSIQWLIGDWLLHGEDRPEWGDKYESVIQRTGKSYSTLTGYKSISRKIPFCRRQQNLSYSHHVEIANANLDQETCWQLLQRAASESWSVRVLRAELSHIAGELPASLSPSPLADRANRKRLDRIWRAVEKEQWDTVKPADLDAIARWLDEIRTRLRKR